MVPICLLNLSLLGSWRQFVESGCKALSERYVLLCGYFVLWWSLLLLWWLRWVHKCKMSLMKTRLTIGWAALACCLQSHWIFFLTLSLQKTGNTFRQPPLPLLLSLFFCFLFFNYKQENCYWFWVLLPRTLWFLVFLWVNIDVSFFPCVLVLSLVLVFFIFYIIFRVSYLCVKFPPVMVPTFGYFLFYFGKLHLVCLMFSSFRFSCLPLLFPISLCVYCLCFPSPIIKSSH